ncbi:MAG: hypothetical protein JNK49_13630 [Planctomycetes bacterium]|nr:hypothetical protein [Planctomycetota bacterium]
MTHRLLMLPALVGSLLAQLPTPSATRAPGVTSREATPGASIAARERAARQQLAPPQAPIGASSAALADRLWFDDQAADGALWVRGSSYKACFDRRGFQYVPFLGSHAPRNFPLRVELRTASVGGERLELQSSGCKRQGEQIRIDRGALVELVDLAPRQIEQSFAFAELPNRGAVAVEIALSGEFAAVAAERGLQFHNDHGGVAYEKAIARDAAGHELPLRIDWRDGLARIEIPAAFVAAASLPLVLDPVLSTLTLSGGVPPAEAQRNPDVARLTVPGITAVSWTRTFSANDEDVFVQILDSAQNFLAAGYVDFTSENWVTARIASNANTSRFLVAAQVDAVTGSFVGSYISSRIIDTTGATLPKVVVEGGNVVGLPGSNFRPDVGGDAAVDPAAFYTIVFEHETAPGNHDIYYKQIDQAGALRTLNPLPLDTSPTMQGNPAIAESNGPVQIGLALVAWQSQRQQAPFDDDVVARWITWNGAPNGPQFLVAGSMRNERRPAVSSYANVIGGQCAGVAWEDDYLTDNDIAVRLFDFGGNPFSTQLNLSAQVSLGAFLTRNQIFPSIETDGNRFAVGYSEFSGSDYDTFAATATWLPGTLAWRLDDDRALLGTNAGTDDYWTRIVADWNFFAPVPNSEYTIVGAAIGSNAIEVRRYGGWLPGNFFTTFVSQCGNLNIAASGAPTTGGFLNFSLVGAGPISGYLFGFPGFVNPTPCPSCIVGVSNAVGVPGPNFTFVVPANPVFVNSFTLSIQGWAFGGNACLGAIDLSNTLDFVIR